MPIVSLSSNPAIKLIGVVSGSASMTAESPLYRDLAYVFLVAVVGGLVARRLRQPLILGYVLGGVVIGRFTPGPTVADTHTLELFAEIGVILLMYSIGIEFSFRDLMRVKWVAGIGGPLGILLSIGVGVATARLLGWSTLQGVTVGAVVSVASTMVLSRLLIDGGELATTHGRAMIGITLVEDLAVVTLTVLLPAMATLTGGGAVRVATALGKSLLILIPVGFLAAKLVPPVMARVARTRNQELYLLVALAIGFVTAAVTQAIGLSLALGAFLAGMVISGSEYAHETLAQLLPLRDAFVALFFVTIGALIDPRSIISEPSLIAVMLLLIVPGKLVIWAAVVWLFRYPFWTALTVAVGLTQIGEFSYVLVQTARGAGLVGADVYNATLAASLISILINAALVKVVPGWIGRRQLRAAARELPAMRHPSELQEHVVLCGFGRIGSTVGTALDTFKVPYVVIEVDPDIVRALRTRGVPCLYGDPAHRTILKEAGVARCRLVAITFPSTDRAVLTVRSVRALNAQAPILARAHRAQDQEELLAAGASEVIQPEVEASATLVQQILRRLQLPEQKASAYIDSFRQAMEGISRESRPQQPMLPVIEEFAIADGAGGHSLGEAHVRERFGVTVISVKRASGEVVLNPPAETRLHAGDRVRVFGLPQQIQSFQAHVGLAPDAR